MLDRLGPKASFGYSFLASSANVITVQSDTIIARRTAHLLTVDTMTLQKCNPMPSTSLVAW